MSIPIRRDRISEATPIPASASAAAQAVGLAGTASAAARQGGADTAGNPALDLAVSKAKKNSVPNDNIERARKRGAGVGLDEGRSCRSRKTDRETGRRRGQLVQCVIGRVKCAAVELDMLVDVIVEVADDLVAIDLLTIVQHSSTTETVIQCDVELGHFKFLPWKVPC